MSWFASQSEEYRLDGLETIESAAQAQRVAQSALTELLELDSTGAHYLFWTFYGFQRCKARVNFFFGRVFSLFPTTCAWIWT